MKKITLYRASDDGTSIEINDLIDRLILAKQWLNATHVEITGYCVELNVEVEDD